MFSEQVRIVDRSVVPGRVVGMSRMAITWMPRYAAACNTSAQDMPSRPVNVRVGDRFSSSTCGARSTGSSAACSARGARATQLLG